MVIAEIFSSIQGESSFAGFPCTFIRLAGCNLRCRYCDATYALEGGSAVEIDEVMERVREAGIVLTELTGGEPLLQEESYPLMERLLGEGYDVLLETNGSLSLEEVDSRVVKIMDVKCPGSGMADRMDFSNIACLTMRDEVKFVIRDRVDFDWAREVTAVYGLIQKCSVLFAPCSPGIESRTLAHWILEEKLPVRLQLQLQKLIWPGQGRGF